MTFCPDLASVPKIAFVATKIWSQALLEFVLYFLIFAPKQKSRIILQMKNLLPFLALTSIATCIRAPRALRPSSETVALASFPQGMSQDVKANIVFSATRNDPVLVHVDVTGLPKDIGTFTYHIHERPVLVDGNCDAVGEHFNPFKAPVECDSLPNNSFCEVGDLSGKHGFINTTCFEATYQDPYLSLNPNSQSFIGGRSIVFHFENNTRFACATIKIMSQKNARQYLETKLAASLVKRSLEESLSTVEGPSNSTLNTTAQSQDFMTLNRKPLLNHSNFSANTIDYCDGVVKASLLSAASLVFLSAVMLL